VIRNLKTLAVYVADQEKSLAFYRDQVGFEVRRDLPMGPLGRWIEVAPPGAESSIVLYPKAMMPDWDKRIPSIVFACDDTVATCAELVKRGVGLVKQPQKMAWGTFASIADLDGNELGLTDQA
jgi:lactoylglutathione lyase